jgi:hypothetical protein
MIRTTLRRLAGLVGLEATSTIQLKDVPDVRLLSLFRCRQHEQGEVVRANVRVG